nr:MAG TPA: hypothetical protein [Caudoviricetes sp.]
MDLKFSFLLYSFIIFNLYFNYKLYSFICK